ncbi:MAG: DUF47 domain-containing protein [Solirubrobacteraceae bacterium]
MNELRSADDTSASGIPWGVVLFRRSRPDEILLGLYEESGRNVQRASLLLRDLLAEYPERAELARDILLCEQEGNRIAHDIIHRLNGDGHRPVRPPFDQTSGYELARALDDIVDHTEQAADELGLYAVEATMEQAVALADVLVGASEQVAGALRSLRTGTDHSSRLVEIHRLENEGRSPPARCRRLAVCDRDRSDGGDSLEGHLQQPRVGSGRL